MRNGSPLAEKETIQAEALWDKPLILSHQASINSERFSWLRTDISRLNVVATYDLFYNAAQFVKKDLDMSLRLTDSSIPQATATVVSVRFFLLYTLDSVLSGKNIKYFQKPPIYSSSNTERVGHLNIKPIPSIKAPAGFVFIRKSPAQKTLLYRKQMQVL